MRILVVLMITFLASAVSMADEDPEEGRLRPRNEPTFQEILNFAKDPNRDVRSRVAWIIGRTGREDGLPTLERLARDPAPDVRAAALLATCQIVPRGTQVAVSLTMPVQDANLRDAALVAAQHLLFEQRDALIRAGLESASASEQALAVRALRLDPPDKARSAILAALENSDPLVRAAAVDVLGNANDPKGRSLVLGTLTERTSGDSFIVRAAACGALARFGTPDGAELLREAVKDEHYFVRREAIKALVERQDRDGISAIQSRVAEEDYTVRECVCLALGEVIDGSSSPLLAARLADEVIEVREAAEKALTGFPPEIAYAALLEYSDYPDGEETRERAWRILAAYAHPATADAAIEHLKDPNLSVGVYALSIGRKLSDRRVIPHVLSLLQTHDASGPTLGQAEEAFRAAILFQLKEPIPFAMLVLKRISNPSLLLEMEKAVWFPSVGDMHGAARYLAAMDYRPAIPLLERILTHPDFTEGPFARELLIPVAEALKQLTGKKYPLPPEIHPLPSWDPLFIDVREETKPAGEV